MSAYQAILVALFAGFGVALGLACLVYVRVLRGHLDFYARAIDKQRQLLDATNPWQLLKAKLQGWHTILLSLAAALAQLVPFLDYWLPEVKGMPWSSVVDEKTANIITIVCTMLIPIVHAQGLAKAAAATPPDGT